MKKYAAIYLLIIISSSHFGCRPKNNIIEQPISQVKPFAIVVDKVIKGKILGSSLDEPFGLAKDINGDIFLTDSKNNRIIRFDKNLKPKYDIGGFGRQAGLLSRPTFLTYDNSLNLLVADELNRRIVRYNAQLNFVEEIKFDNDIEALDFGLPSGVSFTNYGEMWVSDRENHQIALFNNVGQFDRILGDYGYTGGQLSSPEKIFKDSYNNFVVCDAGNRRLMFYDQYGNHIKEITNDLFEYPISAAISKDIIWVLDGISGVLFCLNKKGTLILKFGPTLLGDSLPLKEPSDILLLDDEHLLISDTGNDRLLLCRIIQEDGN